MSTMNYKELHLEAIMLPEHIEGTGLWDVEVPPFSISVVDTEHNGRDVTSWSIEFSPSFDFDQLNVRLEAKGIEGNGYGWAKYILQYIAANYPKASGRIMDDSGAETCCLYTYTRNDFTGLLKIMSESIRELYS
jgi:hypothetical protein